MGVVSTTQFKQELTSVVGNIIKTTKLPQQHFTKMFAEKVTMKELYGWESMEMKEGIATDVPRNTDGNANSFEKSYEFYLKGAEFHEYFNVNQILSAYDAYLVNDKIEKNVFNMILDDIQTRSTAIYAKISNAIEKQACSIAYNGTTAFAQLGTTTFAHRPAGSMVDITGTSGYFSVAACDVLRCFKDAADYFRIHGHNDKVFDVVMSTSAANYLQATDYYKDQSALFMNSDLVAKKSAANGLTAAYFCTFATSSGTFNIFTYDGGVSSGTALTRFMDVNYAVFSPVDKVAGSLVYYPVDKLIDNGNFIAKQVGKYTTWSAGDKKAQTLEQHFKTRLNLSLEYPKTAFYTAKVINI